MTTHAPVSLTAILRPMEDLLAIKQDRYVLVLTKRGVWSSVEFSGSWTTKTLYGVINGRQAMDGGDTYPDVLDVPIKDCVGWIDCADLAEAAASALTA